MKKEIPFFPYNDHWLMNDLEAEIFSYAANFAIAGTKVNTGFFAEISLPVVPGNIELIPVVGIMTKTDVFRENGTRALTQLVNQAAADPSKEAIILYFENVPGGQVDGTQIFADSIKKAANKKPVITSISGICCGSGYWAASQSTEIFATSNTDQIGGIGIIVRLKNPALIDADIIEVVSDLSPDKNKEFKDVQILKDMYLNPVATIFKDAVKAGRGDRLITGDKVLTGGTFISADAKKNGLIEGVMRFEKIVQRANYLITKNKI